MTIEKRSTAYSIHTEMMAWYMN